MIKVKKQYKVEGMHCTSCAMIIEGELEDIGVQAKCSYASQLLEVEADPAQVTDEIVCAAVKKAGYKLAAVNESERRSVRLQN